MILMTPDHDIKQVDFFKKMNEIEHALLSVKKISFLIFYDDELRVCFDSHDENFQIFLDNFRNIYPVTYTAYTEKIEKMQEMHFIRNPIFPLNPEIDILSFIANRMEKRKYGAYRVEAEISKIPGAFFQRKRIMKKMMNLKTQREKIIAEKIISKLSSPVFRVRIFTSDPQILKIAYDFVTGQGLRDSGKRIFMTPEELSFFIHYPLSYNSWRKPW